VELKLSSKELLGAKKKAQEKFYILSYKTKADAGHASINMLNFVEEIEKIFRRSRTLVRSSLQIH
jgi:hypothetical protein